MCVNFLSKEIRKIGSKKGVGKRKIIRETPSGGVRKKSVKQFKRKKTFLLSWYKKKLPCLPQRYDR